MKQPLWTPSVERMENANLTRFRKNINSKYNQQLTHYSELHHWSVNYLREFWAEIWNFTGIISSKSFSSVLDDTQKMIGAKWFEGAKLNFAENLLRYRDERIALIFYGEDKIIRKISYKQLYQQVAQVAKSLRDMGVVAGDRVVGFMPNMPETIIAMLAATSIGAIWSSCSPDFGIRGVLDRFGQIQPKVLFTVNGYFYNGKSHDCLGRTCEIVKDLPKIEKIVVIPYAQPPAKLNITNAVYYEEFINKTPEMLIEFCQLPFEHPLYIMYSSGTTGLPKCLVQSAGGVLINHLKELTLHVDLRREDTIFYFTTCGWMMWNWLVSSLAVGATLVLYEGSPFYPDHLALWRIAEKENISVFGTSARYITALMKEQTHAKDSCNLAALKTVLSTGSPLPMEGFHYVYDHIKKDVHLASISGGTDLNGCFVAGNPTAPVYEGEIQCPCLGMKVESWDENGQPQQLTKGELVCSTPFPSMPIYFWNDQDHAKYKGAYYNVYSNVWRHGDYIEFTETGGAIIYGRSDTTLKPGGVRIGTAEIYRQVETLEEIADSIVVGQDWQNDIRIVLFVKLKIGVPLTEALKEKIKTAIRHHASPRHVPAKIIAINDIPYTLNMKKVEVAVRETIHGRPVVNKDALVNPQSLESFKNIPELQF